MREWVGDGMMFCDEDGGGSGSGSGNCDGECNGISHWLVVRKFDLD